MKEGVTIGRLAKAAAVNGETIRYYQRRGLIAEPNKPIGGPRRYAPVVMEQIAFIRRAPQLGFSLAGVKSLMEPPDRRNLKATRLTPQKKPPNRELHTAHVPRRRTKLQAP